MYKKNFYRDCYLQTGWIPMQPLTRKLVPGDICQIQDGEFRPLLNMVDAHVLEDVKVSHAVPLDGVNWELSRGVKQGACKITACKDDDGERYQRTKQVLEFSSAGSFMFHAHEPTAHLLLNWHMLSDDLIVKLTQLHYSFRHAYVITGVATMKNWGLAVAGQSKAWLEMTATVGNTDWYSMLSHSSARTVKCKGMAGNEMARGMPAYFFKAKRLVLSNAMRDHFVHQVLHNRSDLSPSAVAHWLDADLLNLCKANELNLSTCLNFFDWVDAGLDDVQLLAG